MKRQCLLYLLCFGITLSAYANDMSIGGHGASLIPLTNHHISMDKEHIQIIGLKLNGPYRQRAWQYRCQYQFTNRTSEPQTVTMGFPFPTLTVGYLPSTPPGVTHQDRQSVLYHFTTTINGQPVPTKITPIQQPLHTDNELHFTHAYAFSVTFKPHQTISIVHRFLTGVTHDPKNRLWAHYILTTGKRWQSGHIYQAILQVKPRIQTHLCHRLTAHPHPSLIPTPPGVTTVNNEAQPYYQWNLQNFNAQHNLALCLETAESFVHDRYVLTLSGAAYNRKSSAWQLTRQQCLFRLYAIQAQYGKIFKSDYWQHKFKKQWWYTPNPHYTSAKLNDLDRYAIKWLQWRLQQYKKNQD